MRLEKDNAINQGHKGTSPVHEAKYAGDNYHQNELICITKSIRQNDQIWNIHYQVSVFINKHNKQSILSQIAH